jgi:hypothetical protein
MPSWVVKAAAVGLLSRVPQGERVAAFVRQHVTKSVHLPDRVGFAKCERAARHVKCFLDVAGLSEVPKDFVALELGTGWFPAAPIAASMVGASRVYTVDVSSHIRWPQIVTTIEVVRKYVELGENPLVRRDRLPLLDEALATNDVSRALSVLGVERIVGDARALSPERPVDLYFSNNTLEHIPEPDLVAIFKRFREVGSSRAVMSHWIDMSDHYMGFDPKIGPFHFLRFSEPQFAWMNGPLHYQNRLRHSDFTRIHEQAGWRVTLDEPTRGTPEDLRRWNLAPQFRRYTEEDLLVYETWMSSARAPVAADRAVPIPAPEAVAS